MLTKWKAGAHEYRLALIVAVAGSLVLVLLLVAPSWFLTEQPSADNKGTRTRAPAYNLPVRPSQAPAIKPKTGDKPLTSLPAMHKTEKQIVPQVKKAPPLKTSHSQATSIVTQPPKSKHSLANGYYVQAGAFKDARRAKKLANSLQHAGWHVQTIIKNHGLHAVLVGPLKTRKKAKNAKLKLVKQSGIKGFIIFNTPGN